ncbi:MAG TPA: electron transport complex subunit RsxC [Candidatus Alistipes excrementipullorum]|nr:electron transport complex subunit RsxC [Candidatus Alistipes excrementipullorum]
MKTFPIGGIHPSDNKQWSKASAIEAMPLPDTVTIPLAQHIGAPAVAKVAKGDKVLTGQLIAEAASFMSANIHSPISGTVTAVDLVPNAQGLRQMMITIKREGDEWAEGIDRSDELVKECNLEASEILARIKNAGIVGMGGATFPTHVKLSIPAGKKAEFLIINGVECEPYLTSDYRTMLEYGERLIVGVRILMKAIDVKKAFIGVENNKPDAVAHLRELAAGVEGVEVVPLKVRYPQGGEKQLIAALTGRQVPPPPALPIDVGAVVCNASTTVAVYDAVQKNKPLIERVVTVTGKHVAQPKNLLARMGTPISALVSMAGGLPEGDVKVLNGGPMMGRAMVNLDSPVTKGCSGITILDGREAQRSAATVCIKCAKCVEACPMGLEPFFLSKMSKRKSWDVVEANRVTDCIECGSCQYTCPASMPLLDFIRTGKQTVMGIIRARAAAKK